MPPGDVNADGATDIVDSTLLRRFLAGLSSCGNALLEPGEMCDGSADLACPGMCQSDCACASCSFFVSGLTGNDVTGNGSRLLPFATIAKGVQSASAGCSSGSVFVAEGSYSEKVTLAEGIDLLGGYQCDPSQCTWARDPTQYDSAVVNTDFQGVLAAAAITRATRFDGFRVMGLGGNPGAGTSSGITALQGTPTLSNDRVFGGVVAGCTGCTSSGVTVLGAQSDPNGALIEELFVQAGSSSGRSFGIQIGDGAALAAALIDGGTIKGSTAVFTRAIVASGTGAATRIERAQVFAGSASNSSATSFANSLGSGSLAIDRALVNTDPAQVGACSSASLWCGGVEINGGSVTLTNNVIRGVAGPRSAAVLLRAAEILISSAVINGNTLSGGGAPGGLSAAIACQTTPAAGTNSIAGRVRNDILLGGAATGNRFAIYEDGQLTRSCHLQDLQYNDVFAADNAYRLWNGASATTYATAAAVNAALVNAVGNFGVDPLLDATSHLLPGSPCINAGTASEAPSADLDGEARPNGPAVDVGADEKY